MNQGQSYRQPCADIVRNKFQPAAKLFRALSHADDAYAKTHESLCLLAQHFWEAVSAVLQHQPDFIWSPFQPDNCQLAA